MNAIKYLLFNFSLLFLLQGSILGQTETKNYFLKDGTTIQGRIVAQDDSILVLDTQYGTLEIQRINITKMEQPKEPQMEIKKPESTTIYLTDGTTIKGIVTFENEDSLGIETDYGVMNIPKSNVKPSEKKFIPKTRESKAPIKTDREVIRQDTLTRDQLSEAKGYWPGQGSTLIGGLVSFSVTRVEGYDKSLISLSLVPNAIFFITNGFGLGFDMSISYESSGENTSTSSIAFGPKIIGAFGNKESTAIPYLGFGLDYITISRSYQTTDYSYYTGYYSYNTSRSYSGYLLKFGFGVMIKVGENLGIPVELGVLYTDIESDSMTNFVLGIGIAGLLY